MAPAPTVCCVPAPQVESSVTVSPRICTFPSDHDGPHEWSAQVRSPASTRALLDPKSMADVVAALSQIYDDEDVPLALATGRVAGGKYPGLTAIDVCCTAEGRYDVWAMAKAMSDGLVV